jgi:hypothetical protein
MVKPCAERTLGNKNPTLGGTKSGEKTKKGWGKKIKEKKQKKRGEKKEKNRGSRVEKRETQ